MLGNPDKKPWLLGAALIALTLLAYQPVWHAGFVWDDDFYVTQNTTLRSWDGLRSIWFQPGVRSQQYYPLSFSGLWAQYHLWKLQPLGYHLVNVLVHALNAVLLWCLLRRLQIPGAWWAAAIFAVHPIMVESAAWVTEFKNVLSGTFSLLSLLAFLRFHPLSLPETSTTRDWRFYAPALLLFLCALLSKTAVCCLPIAMGVLIWWKQERVSWRDVLALMPWFVASATLGLLTVQVEAPAPDAGTTGSTLSRVDSVLLAGRALWFYVGKVFWPRPLSFVYPRWEIDARAPWQYLFPLGALVVVVTLWRLRRRIGKGPLAGVLCFGAMLLPVLGFFNIFFFRYSYVTDHFQYLASIALIVLAVSAAAAVYRRIGQLGRGVVIYAGVVVLALLGWTTWTRAHVYRDLETLWKDTLAKNPACWMAHSNLSGLLIPEGRFKEALRHSEAALRLKPDYVEACYNSALALENMGRMRDAIVRYGEAIRIKPDYPPIYNNLAWLLATIPATEGGDVVRAVALSKRGCELTSNHLAPYLDTLAVAYAASGDFKQAIVTEENAITLARSSGQPQYIGDMTSHLDLFHHGRIYRRPAAGSASSHP